ncbi:MAG: general secretion pathway protein I [Gammaproteobacteria bacterium]|jgi:general secretion pathway protein I
MIVTKFKGFTLLEIMIALLIIVVGLVGVIESTGNSIWQSSHLKNKTLAIWVAHNQIALYRAKRTWNDTSNLNGKTEMANVDWLWKMTITPTDDKSLRRIDIEVYLDGHTELITSMTGFIGQL